MTIGLDIAKTFSSQTSGMEVCPEQLINAPLADHLRSNIAEKTGRLMADDHQYEVLTPDWCRQNPVEAGRLHADIIIKTYGDTYALPNKDPIANQQAIDQGELDVYLLMRDDEVVGTACMVDNGDGRAELGRSASIGGVGNTIIQDLRILDWLTDPEKARKFHSLFTTLRNAPDRLIDSQDGSSFVMRGGQNVTSHWKKFPGLVVTGFGPLYLKHGALEQFSCASVTRNEIAENSTLYVRSEAARRFIQDWHENYQLGAPVMAVGGSDTAEMHYAAHYPPLVSGITELVHADIVPDATDHARPIDAAVQEAVEVGSPFLQVVVPVSLDSREVQAYLEEDGFQIFAYQPEYQGRSAELCYGKVKEGVPVVPTYWDAEQLDNPYWTVGALARHAIDIANRWNER